MNKCKEDIPPSQLSAWRPLPEQSSFHEETRSKGDPGYEDLVLSGHKRVFYLGVQETFFPTLGLVTTRT